MPIKTKIGGFHFVVSVAKIIAAAAATTRLPFCLLKPSMNHCSLMTRRFQMCTNITVRTFATVSLIFDIILHFPV